jgi:hypothetical protein
MTQLYSYKRAYPYPLPINIEFYNINDFVLAPEKPNLLPGEQLEWSGDNWVVRGPNSSEIAFEWQNVRIKRNQLLAESDILVVRAYENGSEVPEEVKTYRQQLRDITQQSDPFNLIWPRKPV